MSSSIIYKWWIDTISMFARDSQACGCGCQTKADKEVEPADTGTSSTKMVVEPLNIELTLW